MMARRALVILLGAYVFAANPGPLAAQSGNAPIVIRDRACLFFDDHFIAAQSGLKRTWHQGKPRPEPAITGRWPHAFGSVLYDARTKLFKMWYEDVADGIGWIYYAESKDGKSWIMPKLGLVAINGAKANNCIWRGGELPNVHIDPKDVDPRGRFKMFLWARTFKVGDKNVSGHVLLRSGDGIRWEYVGPGPSVGLPEGDETGQARTVLDTQEITWDPLGRRYLGTFRLFPRHPGLPGWFRNPKFEVTEGVGGHRRAVGVAFADRLDGKWTRQMTALKADARDDEKPARLSKNAKPDWAELYVMPVFTYGNHYLGMVSLLYFVDGVHGDTAEGGGDLQFTFSHDGARWFRQPDRQSMVAPATRGMVPCYAQGNEPLELGDELWIYYTEAESAHPKPHHKSFIRAATWRKDGFVSLDAADAGSLTTRPLKFDGKRLLLNVNCQGTVRVAVLNDAGKPLPGLGLQDCDPLTGDQVRGVASWGGRADLSALSGKTVRLRVEMSRGSLFSFRVSAE